VESTGQLLGPAALVLERKSPWHSVTKGWIVFRTAMEIVAKRNSKSIENAVLKKIFGPKWE